MLQARFRFVGRIGLSHLLCVVLGITTLLPLACGSSSTDHSPRLLGDENNGGSGDPGAAGANGNGNGAPSNDPQNPTNTGPQHNSAGFAAIAPVMQARCSECHHPGTWLDLQSGADSNTADKIVNAITQGTMPPAPRTAPSADEIAAIKTWRDGGTPNTPTIVSTDPSTMAITQVLSADALTTYKAALPKVGWPRLAKILTSPSTLFWDKATIPPAYQDTVGDGSSLPFGARFNSAGKELIVDEGKKLFSDDGKTWSYPFGHTAGADASTNLFIVDFLSLPPSVDGSAVLPVAYKIETAETQGLPIKRWNWSYPKGTIVGEIIMIRDSSGALLTTEIRTRERFADAGGKWATDAFRPFPTASILSAAVKQRKPQWQGTADLSKLVSALDDTSTLVAKHLDSPAFSNLVTLDGVVDAPLPDVNDDDLVRDLLKTTTFVGSYGTVWKQSGTQRAFGITGPASANSLSVVPNGFDTGLLEVRETTCENCHNQGGYFIGDLVDQAILYGDIWGVDRIFSFHPFNPALIDASGNENRSVRTELTSIVVPFDPAAHPDTIYTFYRPTPVPAQ